MSREQNVSSIPERSYDVRLLVRDPISSFDSERLWRVRSPTPGRAGTIARKDYERRCAPIKVKEVLAVEEAR